MFKKPLENYISYITHIVLDNCIDYLEFKKNHRENSYQYSPATIKTLRLYLNAAISVNHIIDYAYFEIFEEPNQEIENKFRKEIIEKTPLFKDISQIANAYKHKRPRNKSLLQATDLSTREVNFSVGLGVGRPLTEIAFGFENHDSETLISNAFQFCLKEINDETPFLNELKSALAKT